MMVVTRKGMLITDHLQGIMLLAFNIKSLNYGYLRLCAGINNRVETIMS